MNTNPFQGIPLSEQQQQNLIYSPQPHLQFNLPSNTMSHHHQSLPEPHAMPEPPSMPWDVNAMPWKAVNSTAVMHFSGNPNLDELRRAKLHQKRKSDQLPPTPAKQFITEEIITKHFNGLHISSSYIQNTDGSTGFATLESMNDPNVATTSGKCFTNLTYKDYQVTAKELEEKLRNANRITMCEEIKKLHEEHKKTAFISEALFNRVERPCTALVLWKPSAVQPLLQLVKEVDKQKAKQDEEKSVMSMRENTELNKLDVDDEEFDDFIDNNNTSSMDFNNLKPDGMDEDL